MKNFSVIMVLALLAYPVLAINEMAAGKAVAHNVEGINPAKVEVEEEDPEMYKAMPYYPVKVYVEPSKKYIKNGEKAVFDVTVVDMHKPRCYRNIVDGKEVEACPAIHRIYEYYMSVEGLPFKLDYPRAIEVGQGSKYTFELVVYTNEYADVFMPESGEDAIQANSGSQKILVGKPYRFTVLAKTDDAIGKDYATLYVGRNISPPPVPGDKVDVKVHRGWNIVSLPGVGRPLAVSRPAESTDLIEKISDEGVEVLAGEIESMPNRHPRKYFFVYLKEEGKYATFKEAIELLGLSDFRRYLLHNAFWVYTPEDDVLSFRVWRYTSFNGMPVTNGWNFIPVTRDMNAQEFGEISTKCEFTRLYMWDKSAQSWYKIGQDHVFDSAEIYSGIVAKARGDCELGLVKPHPSVIPPSLPD